MSRTHMNARTLRCETLVKHTAFAATRVACTRVCMSRTHTCHELIYVCRELTYSCHELIYICHELIYVCHELVDVTNSSSAMPSWPQVYPVYANLCLQLIDVTNSHTSHTHICHECIRHGLVYITTHQMLPGVYLKCQT